MTDSLSDTEDVLAKRADFYKSVNSVFGNFGKLSCDIINDMFNADCTSFYGSQCWNFRNSSLCKLYSA